jgi:hypothetical protein
MKAVNTALATENWLVPKLLAPETRNCTGVPSGNPVIRTDVGGILLPVGGFTATSGTAGVTPSEANTVRTTKPVNAWPFEAGIQLTNAVPVETGVPPGGVGGVEFEAVTEPGTAGGAPDGG